MLQFDYNSQSQEREKYTVSELTREIKIILETTLPVIWLEGEISNFKKHSSGHFYFSLKDENAQIACVMWRTRNSQLFFTPQDGMKVLALGQVTVYEKRGNYQFDVLTMKPLGVGELQLAYDQLKKALREQGLFDEQFKKPIPKFPEKVGIVTSPTGAAIRDIVNIIHRRFPAVDLILRPTLVQGEGSAADIAAAIKEFNEYAEVDVIIIGRGGGSLEDLWAFNEEVVAHAIFQSKIPIISAVGHEIDFCISDFVADLRAPTPSAAAELVVPDSAELKQRIQFLISRIYQKVAEKISYNREKLVYIQQTYSFRRPADLILQFHQRLDELTHSLEVATSHKLQLQRERLDSLTKRLLALSPQAILKRGYSICFRAGTLEVIKEAHILKPHDQINVRLYKGQVWGDIYKVENDR